MAKKQETETQAEETKNLPATQEVSQVPAISGLTMDDIAADAGAGTQNITAQDLATPIIMILQSNSPQCKKSDGKYISGASEGMFFNNVTNETYDGEKGLQVIPCYFEKVFIEWKPNRGGLVAIHNVDTPLKDQVKMVEVTQPDGQKKLVSQLPNGNTFAETNQHYVLLLKDDGSYEPAVISMASSALKSSRVWNTLLRKIVLKDKNGKPFTPPSYYSMFKLTTAARQKNQNSWFGWNVEVSGTVPNADIYNAAKAFEKAVAGGTVKVKVDEGAHADGAPAYEPGAEADIDDNIPF